ncbi:MAG: hypothetical protein JSV44_08185 [Candidatus Zixiibacteriota bacterium]|nr:MAG: hypothetical protein JSV44_08185 [candidate division Zixibacteria bacterium]
MTRISEQDIKRIAAVLNPEKMISEKDHYRLKISNRAEKRVLVLEIYPEVLLGRARGMLVVVYTGNSHLQLHNCTGFVISEELGEITFVAERDDQLSGLVVERGASCSLYASLDRALISSDFTKLGVEVMLSGVALSLAEGLIIPEDKADSE